MKATVTRAYTDRILKAVRIPGETVELSDERLEELIARGFVTEGTPKAEPAGAAAPAPEPEGDAPVAEAATDAHAGDRVDAPDIELMTIQELVSYIGRMGGSAPSKAKKAALVEIAKGL